MTIFSERVEALRKEKKLTVRQLEDATGISKSTISDWKNKCAPTSENLLTIANFFDVSIDYLFGRTNNRISHKTAHTDMEKICLEAEKLGLDENEIKFIFKVIEALAQIRR